MAASFSSVAATNIKAAVASIDDIEDLVTVNGAPFVNAPDELPVQTANAVIVGTATAPGFGAVVESSDLKVTNSGTATTLTTINGANHLVLANGTVATTPAVNDNDTSVATTAFIYNQLSTRVSFTPTIGTLADDFTGLSNTSCIYTIVGKCAFVRLFIVWTAVAGTGNIYVKGMPFSPANNNNRFPLFVFPGKAYPANAVGFEMFANNTDTNWQIKYISSATGAEVATVDTDYAASGTIFANFSIQIA